MKQLCRILLITFSIQHSSFNILYSQNPLVKKWDHQYGGKSNDELLSFQQTADGGYLLAGNTASDSSFDVSQKSRGSIDMWVVKTDSLGKKQWDKRFGGSTSEDLHAALQTKDGGYIIGGYTLSGVNGDVSEPTRGSYDYWIVKTDSAGNKKWDRRYGGSSFDYLYALQQTSDGGYILGGYTASDSGDDVSQPKQGNNDYWVVKTDSAGNKKWDKRFGGKGDDRLQALRQTADGGYILGGYSSSDSTGDVSQHSHGSIDYWIIKTDSAGNKQWDKRFGGASPDYLYDLEVSPDGYALSGISSSSHTGDVSQYSYGGADFWVVKTDLSGKKLWEKRFGGKGIEDEYGYIRKATGSGGGYLISGSSYSDVTGTKTEANLGAEQSWMLKMDSLGGIFWDKTIFTKAHDEGGFALMSSDGCYVVANFTNGDSAGYKTMDALGGTDFWMVKFCDTTHYCPGSRAGITADTSSICSGDSAHLCAPPGYLSYQWHSGETSRCITSNSAGNYYLTVTDVNNCTAESNHFPLAVYPVPSVSIVAKGDTLSSYGAVTYQWYLGGHPIDQATDSVYVAHDYGSYTVAVTDSNGCGAVSNPIVLTGVEDLNDEGLLVYPNPSNGNWQLTVGNSLIGSKVEVCDESGRLVFQSAIRNPKSEITLNVAPGIYLLRIYNCERIVTRKLVKW